MYLRWIYMLIAIGAAAFLLTRPVFDFQEDKGIIYVRSFEMDQHTFRVTQTEMTTGAQELTAVMSVDGLYYCNKVMLWGCIACLLCFFKRSWRMLIALFTALVTGVYYCLMVYYAIKMSDVHYATLSPNLMAALPAVVCQMMILVRHNIIRAGIDEDEQSLIEE